jgi:transcriptional regulator with XRE-family HTH domain
MRTEFAERLHQARKAAKFTQLKLARAVGMSQGTLGALELTGQGSSYTPAIARELGVSVEWLAYGNGEMRADASDPAIKAVLSPTQYSDMASSLARLFDSLPDDHVLRARVCVDASRPLLEMLGQTQQAKGISGSAKKLTSNH